MKLVGQTRCLLRYDMEVPPETVIRRRALKLIYLDKTVFAGEDPPERISVQVFKEPD